MDVCRYDTRQLETFKVEYQYPVLKQVVLIYNYGTNYLSWKLICLSIHVALTNGLPPHNSYSTYTVFQRQYSVVQSTILQSVDGALLQSSA